MSNEDKWYISGPLGIGAPEPAGKLDVQGDMQVEGSLKVTKDILLTPQTNIVLNQPMLNIRFEPKQRLHRIVTGWDLNAGEMLNVHSWEAAAPWFDNFFLRLGSQNSRVRLYATLELPLGSTITAIRIFITDIVPGSNTPPTRPPGWKPVLCSVMIGRNEATERGNNVLLINLPSAGGSRTWDIPLDGFGGGNIGLVPEEARRTRWSIRDRFFVSLVLQNEWESPNDVFFYWMEFEYNLTSILPI